MNRHPMVRRRVFFSLCVYFLVLANGLFIVSAQTVNGKITMKTSDSPPASASGTTVSLQSNRTGVEQTQIRATPSVLVELFTSEGCSSCPPADKLLATLIEAQPIKGVRVIALSEHVDYWNRLGWKDPFSAAEFSQRQVEYLRALGGEDVFTPQMIVDGRTALIGSQAGIALEAIAKAALLPKADVRVSIKTSTHRAITLIVQVENLPTVSDKDSAEVMMAISEDGLQTKVSRGENAGRDLLHAAVTRKLIKLGTIKDKTFYAEPKVNLDANWKRQNLNAVVFVQERASRKVQGVAAIKLSSEL